MKRSGRRWCWLLCGLLVLGCGGDGAAPGGGAGGAPPVAGSGAQNPQAGAGGGAAGQSADPAGADDSAYVQLIQEAIRHLGMMSSEYESFSGSGQSSIELTKTGEAAGKMDEVASQLTQMPAPSAEQARRLKDGSLPRLKDAIRRAELAQLHLEREYTTFGGWPGQSIGSGIADGRRILRRLQRSLPASEQLSFGRPASLGGTPGANRSFGQFVSAGIPAGASSLGGSGRAPIPWRLSVDPPAHFESLPGDVQLDVTIPHADEKIVFGFGPQVKVLYPAMPSVFVGVGLNETAVQKRNVWSLEPRRRIGAVKQIQLRESPWMALSADGQYYAGFPKGAQIVGVYDVDREKPIQQIPLSESREPTLLEFAADNRLLVLLGQTLQVWSVPDGEMERQIDLGRDVMTSHWHGGRSWGLSPGGRYLAIPGAEGFRHDVLFVDVTTGEPAGEIELDGDMHTRFVAVDFTNDGERLALLIDGSFNSWIQVWEVAQGRLVASFKADKPISGELDHETNYLGPAIEWFPDGRRLLLMGKGIFDADSGEGVKQMPSSTEYRIGLLEGDRIMVHQQGKLVGYDLSEIPDSRQPWEPEKVSATSLLAQTEARQAGIPPTTEADRSQIAYPESDSAGWSVSAAPAESVPVSDVSVEGFSESPLYHALVSDDGSRSVASFSDNEISIFSGEVRDLENLTIWIEHTPLPGSGPVRRLDPEIPSTLLAVSPDGNRLCLRSLEGFNRLDFYDLNTGQHETGFVPYEQGSSTGGDPVLWADFVDQDRLLTLAAGRLTLWSVPDCRAVYEAGVSTDILPVLSPGRQYVALSQNDPGGLRLLSTEDGTVAGDVTLPGDADPVSAVAFDAAGGKLAAVTSITGGSEVHVIDCDGGQITATFPTPIVRTSVLQWIGSDRLLLDGAYLVGLTDEALEWIYQLRGTHVLGQAGGRHWFFEQPEPKKSRTLACAALPDSETQAALAAGSASNERVVQPGSRIALDIQVPSPPGRGNFAQEVRTAFTEKLASHEITVDDAAPVRIVVRGSHEKTGEGISIRRFGLNFRRDTDLDEERVTWTVAIQQGEQVLWRRTPSANNTGRLDIEEDTSFEQAVQQAEQQLRKQMWDRAGNMLIRFALPRYVFSQEAASGLGKSSLTAAGG